MKLRVTKAEIAEGRALAQRFSDTTADRAEVVDRLVGWMQAHFYVNPEAARHPFQLCAAMYDGQRAVRLFDACAEPHERSEWLNAWRLAGAFAYLAMVCLFVLGAIGGAAYAFKACL